MMRMLCFMVLASVVSFGHVLNVLADEKPNPRENLETAIAECIRLLEAKDYRTFIETFMEPKALALVTARQPIDELARKVGEGKGAAFLVVLKTIQMKEPVISDDGQRATFEHGLKGLPRDTLTFQKIEKFWYVEN